MYRYVPILSQMEFDLHIITLSHYEIFSDNVRMSGIVSARSRILAPIKICDKLESSRTHSSRGDNCVLMRHSILSADIYIHDFSTAIFNTINIYTVLSAFRRYTSTDWP